MHSIDIIFTHYITRIAIIDAPLSDNPKDTKQIAFYMSNNDDIVIEIPKTALVQTMKKITDLLDGDCFVVETREGKDVKVYGLDKLELTVSTMATKGV